MIAVGKYESTWRDFRETSGVQRRIASQFSPFSGRFPEPSRSANWNHSNFVPISFSFIFVSIRFPRKRVHYRANHQLETLKEHHEEVPCTGDRILWLYLFEIKIYFSQLIIIVCWSMNRKFSSYWFFPILIIWFKLLKMISEFQIRLF